MFMLCYMTLVLNTTNTASCLGARRSVEVQLEVTFPLAVPPLTPMRKGRWRGRSASPKGTDTSMAVQRCRFLLNNFLIKAHETFHRPRKETELNLPSLHRAFHNTIWIMALSKTPL